MRSLQLPAAKQSKTCGCFASSQGTRETLPEISETPERLQSKLGEGTTHGNHVNTWLYKVELKVNLERSRFKTSVEETAKHI